MLCNPGYFCLATWELWNCFFRGKELERLTHSAACDRHCLAYQAEDFILTSHGDIYPLAGSGVCAWHCRCGFWDWTPSTPSHPLPTCQQALPKAEFWQMFRCVIFHPLATLFYMQFIFHQLKNASPPYQSTMAITEERRVPLPILPHFVTSSLQDLTFQPCVCPASIVHAVQQRCHLLVLHLCNAAFHLS